MRPTACLAVLAICLAGPAMAQPARQRVLRELAIGMPVSAMPATGYGGFFCADAPSTHLQSWADYTFCPPQADGLRAVRFRYDDGVSGDASKTLVGGHPVILTALIGSDAQLDGLQISTDPQVPLYLHKKAFLLGRQAKLRFGEEGWTCTRAQPSEHEQPIGNVFMNDHCEKTVGDLHIAIDEQLYHDPSLPLKDFVNGTQIKFSKAT